MPAFAIENVEPDEQLPRDQCRDESLREMAEPIVMVATPVKIIAEPVKKRLVRVGPMSADAQDRDVKRDQGVNERGELKSPVSGRENDDAGDSGKHFEPPGEAIVRIDSRPNENDRDAN